MCVRSKRSGHDNRLFGDISYSSRSEKRNLEGQNSPLRLAARVSKGSKGCVKGTT
jgi:hypothetical protein